MYNADYTPDNWVVLKITNTKRSGNTGYGRTLVFDREDEVHFHGESGSVYRCQKGAYGLRMSTSGIYKQLQEFPDSEVELIPEDTDWSKLV